MAIVTMKRLTLLALSADKEKIYDELCRSQSVHLKRSADIDSCVTVDESVALEKVMERTARVEEAISYVTETVDGYNAAHKRDKVTLAKNSLARPKSEIDFDYFLSFGAHAEGIESSLNELFGLRDKVSALRTDKASKIAERNAMALFEALPHPTTWYKSTESATVQLSTIPTSELEHLSALADAYETVSCEVVDSSGSTAVVVAVAHKSEKDFFDKAIALGLNKCAVNCDVLPRLVLEQLNGQIQQIDEQVATTQKQIVDYGKEIPTWKIYVDYLELQSKKLVADCDLQQTASTFVLEAFYPAESQDKVEQAIYGVTDNVVLTFDDIGEDEFAPTLTKNNAVVRQFESVTNMYTPPTYHEVDPNPVMSVFYFIIFGFMVADIGYGVLLMLAGLFALFALKQRSGVKTMLQMFGFCGISATVVGALFGSCFSYQLYPGVIPNPSEYPMVMIIVSLILGVAHILAGVGCKMAVKYKHNQKLAAWLADFPWIIVFFAFVIAIWNAAIDMAAYEPYGALKLPSIVGSIALYVALIALVVAIVCAGVNSKGFKGKLTSSFGSVYGIINYFSDIMSYIRIFGLMLSSALIGSVVNMLASMVSEGGGLGYVFAALVLVLAHMFNLVMGILSVYIHNGRLQYVEFFGKFYTGDGVLFVPFGSDTRYTLVK